MEFTKNESEKFSTWKNQISDLNKISDLKKHHEKVYEMIKSNYTNENSIKTHLLALGSILKKIKGPIKAIKKYNNEAVIINNNIVDILKNNEPDEKRCENFVSSKELNKKRKSLEFFTSNKENIQHLILSLYTLQPPIRMNYLDVKIYDDNDKGDDNENYIVRNKNKFVFYLNDDKVIKSHGPIILPFSGGLNSIIKKSLKDYPRDYLLSVPTDPSKGITKITFERLLNEVFEPKNVGIDIIRSAYIIDFYSKKKSVKQKEELAKLMRHSKSTAELNYVKFLLCK